MASMNEETMLFDPEKNLFFQLNPTAAFLWKQLTEPNTPERLADEVCKRFEGAVSGDVLRDVQEILTQMRAHQVVVVED